MDTRKLIHSITACAALTLPLGAQQSAGDPPQEPVASYQDVLFVEESLPNVPDSNTIATKLPLPLQRTPASVGVVSRPLFQEQGALVLGDALRNVSGLNVQTQSGVADFFVVRGFDSISSGLVLTDGANEPEISFYQLYNIERVEVLKGPGAFLYGGSPIAGTVNMVRKQPEPGDFLSAGFTAGSYGTYGGRIDGNASASGGLDFRVNGLWQSSDGYRDDKPSEVQAVNPAFTWRRGEKISLNVNAELVDASFSPDAGLPLVQGFDILPIPGGGLRTRVRVADVDRTRSYQSPYDRSEQDIRRLQADYQAVVSDRLTVRNKTYYRRLDWLSNGTIFNGVFPNFFGSGDLVSRSLLLLDDRQEFLGDQLEVVYSGRTGAVTHELLAGVEAARLTDRFTLDVGLLPVIGLQDPVETAAGPVLTIPQLSSSADAESIVIAPYLIDQIKVSDRLQVVLGARFDLIDYEDPATSTERDDSQLSPVLGLVYSPVPSLSLYANTARSFAPPSTRVVGDREPEESSQVEAGAKADLWDGRVQATLALYELERENMAIPDATGFTQQLGSQRSRGVELELAAEPLPRLRALFSYAYTDAELTRFAELVQIGFEPPAFSVVDRSGNTPAFAPEHIASLWLSRRFGKGLGLGLGGRFLSEQLIAEDNAFELDASTTFDAALFYELGAWRLSLNLKNLSDEKYFTRGFGTTSVIPADGFALYGGVEYRMGWQ